MTVSDYEATKAVDWRQAPDGASHWVLTKGEQGDRARWIGERFSQAAPDFGIPDLLPATGRARHFGIARP